MIRVESATELVPQNCRSDIAIIDHRHRWIIFVHFLGRGWCWLVLKLHLPSSSLPSKHILYCLLGYFDWVYCLLTWVVSTFVGRILSQCSPWHPFFVHHVEGVTRHCRHACIRFVPPMYLLFIPHQKSNGCCISDRHLPSYPIRQAYIVYYFPSCTFTMPYSFGSKAKLSPFMNITQAVNCSFKRTYPVISSILILTLPRATSHVLATRVALTTVQLLWSLYLNSLSESGKRERWTFLAFRTVFCY